MDDLPFKAEYSKTGRAGCKGCKQKIDQGTLRIAAMVQSAFHDGKQPNWYHESCLFKKLRPGGEGDIENFSNLRFDDQERIRKKISESSTVVEANGKGKKRTKGESSALKDFGIEKAKSGRAGCRGCEQKILKDTLRIRKTVYDTEVGMKYGGQPLWHHVECFAQVRNDLGWFASGQDLPGFKSLSKDDQDIVKKAIPVIKSEDVPDAKKPKLEKKDPDELKKEKEDESLYKKQMDMFFKFRDAAKKQMTKPQMQDILEENHQDPVVGDSEKLLDQLADLLTFGALRRCEVCKEGQFLFNNSGYLCTGSISEWAKCANLVKEPPRKRCRISEAMQEEFSFLKKVKKSPENRYIRYLAPSTSTLQKRVKKEDELDGPRVKRERPPLYNMTFSLIGIKDSEGDIKKKITDLGGIFLPTLNEKTTVAISNEKEVVKMSSRMLKAREMGIHVVPVEYLDAVKEDPTGALSFVNSKTLCDWGTDPAARIPQEDSNKSKSKSIYTKSVPKSMKLTLKDGMAVDPDSGLEDVAKVYVRGKDKYNVVLGLTDIQRNKNSYYKLQVLVGEKKNKFWLFRSWGRIGTTIGGNKTEDFSTLDNAIDEFERLYLEKSGNEFCNRDNFIKHPGAMYPIDIDYGDDVKIDLNAAHPVKSKLPTPTQDLIKLLFDIESMKKTMLEFDLDMEKMPLGKLSQKQIQSAYKVLSEVNALIQNGGSNPQFIDCTNRFYTLIPHNFGVENPPLLDTVDQVNNLSQMLDSLLEIECAYSLISHEDTSDDLNPLDRHYDQLKTQLDPIDHESEEFKFIQKYVKNTHAETHQHYELVVEDVFKVARQGEARRYKPFRKLHNRRLLWHGSRLTNYVGILSHGLKIAPPEAPVTGYMFGKGLYFADMVSKSANYCFTSKQNNTGLMLLSEVALGDMYELNEAKYITKLPKDKHSTFGIGKTQPNPEGWETKDGVQVPCGLPMRDDKLKSSLLYNEFIVYDVAQVNIKYLLKMNFKYKY
ncbi:PARP1 family protein [Megaselia abdita]